MSISTDTLVKVENHKGSSAPVPCKVLSFTDPFPYQSAFRSVDVELFPTAKGEFRADLTQISMSKLWIHGAHESLPRVYVGAVRPHRAAIGFLTEANQPAMQHCGMEVLPGDIIVNNADMMHRRTAANCDWGSMSLPPDDLNAACKAITGDEFSKASLKHLVRPSRTLMSRLLKLHGMVRQIAKTTPDLLELPEVVRALEQELIHVMIRCLTGGESSELTARGRSHDMIIARFEEFLDANPDQPLHLIEICAAIGVAERTLRLACEEHLGMGPIRYLNLRRMHLVRHTLARRSIYGNCYTIGHRPRFLGAGALLSRLPSIIWRVTVGIAATTTGRSAHISKSPVNAREPNSA